VVSVVLRRWKPDPAHVDFGEKGMTRYADNISWFCIGLIQLGILIAWATFSCNTAPVASANKLASDNTAPLVEASAEVNAALLQKITKLEAKIGELEAQIGGNRAGGNIWNIGTGGASMAAMLLFYVLSDRWGPTRAIKEIMKGKRRWLKRRWESTGYAACDQPQGKDQ
jgi:hypothetical protein